MSETEALRAERAKECWRVQLGTARFREVVPTAHHTAFGIYLNNRLQCEQDMSEEIALVLAVCEPVMIEDLDQLAKHAASFLEIVSYGVGKPLDADGACEVMIPLCAIVPSIGRAAMKQARYLRRKQREERRRKNNVDALNGRACKRTLERKERRT